ncbi:SDR family NAD(P)-dependent oxidoreductase [Streptomyces marispadix]|uniref:SDR family NAD(P)-dependent oxidoreductase n=1 Tax=Streptomyces marispadix TaxID=2922868 RepID=A0ABS9SZ74_9ACTN|nr:SDR family NAD(P)-dependent oxidoreductase [Streptomyces marispadix]MCH6161584.1 SDR family NAD(P)-dependent oxidoreductase [Streptomyces marispadix]
MPSAFKTSSWDVHRLPHAEGKSFLVTGGNAGIGYFVAEQLAGTGATVVLGSRDEAKAKAAIASISSRVPGADVRHLRLDLADLSSLRTSVDALELGRLDAVVYNAGVALDHPPRRETEDGHELMFATNHLGHFALTRWLAPLLMATPESRIVTTGRKGRAAGRDRTHLEPPGRQHDRGAPMGGQLRTDRRRPGVHPRRPGSLRQKAKRLRSLSERLPWMGRTQQSAGFRAVVTLPSMGSGGAPIFGWAMSMSLGGTGVLARAAPELRG